MIQMIIGQKKDQSQKFLTDGTRVPVTEIWCNGNTVIAVKTKDRDGYDALQLGFGLKKNPTKALQGHIKAAKLEKAPKFMHEVRLTEVTEDLPKHGDVVTISTMFKPGDIVDVIGTSKGKGFAGGVKRYHFKGGPRTHGQSDRERAPGSIGQTTTPGRVYKGKRMAGRMGHETVTIKNLSVVSVNDETLLLKGLVPGIKNGILYIEKVGELKKFTPLMQDLQQAPEPTEQPAATPEIEEKPEEVTKDAVVESAATPEKEGKQDEKVAEKEQENAS